MAHNASQLIFSAGHALLHPVAFVQAKIISAAVFSTQVDWLRATVLIKGSANLPQSGQSEEAWFTQTWGKFITEHHARHLGETVTCLFAQNPDIYAVLMADEKALNIVNERAAKIDCGRVLV